MDPVELSDCPYCQLPDLAPLYREARAVDGDPSNYLVLHYRCPICGVPWSEVSEVTPQEINNVVYAEGVHQRTGDPR